MSCASELLFIRYYGPFRPPSRPGLTLAGCRLATLHHRWGFPPACDDLPACLRAVTHRQAAQGTAQAGGRQVLRSGLLVYMPSPLPRRDRWMLALLPSPTTAALPRNSGESAPALPFFEACSAFTHLTSCILAQSPCDPLHRRLRRRRCLRPRSEACRAIEEAGVKVGQTFLSALLIVLLPQCRQKRGLRRLYRANTRSRAVRLLWGFPRCSRRSANTAFRCAQCDHRTHQVRKFRCPP